MPYFNIVAETNENTVVTEYEPVKRKSDTYQSEAELEKEFIRLLCEQGYEYLPIHTEEDLIRNLRSKLEELNDYKFSDTEWERFFNGSVANKNEGIADKTRKIQIRSKYTIIVCKLSTSMPLDRIRVQSMIIVMM